MSMSDPIADLLTRIRNAILRKHQFVTLPSSRVKVAIAEVLKQEGFVENYKVEEAKVGKSLTIGLKYDRRGDSVIQKIDRVSKPGLRIFRGAKEIKPLLNGQGIYVVSTSDGVMSDVQCRQKNVGGELMCSVY